MTIFVVKIKGCKHAFRCLAELGPKVSNRCQVFILLLLLPSVLVVLGRNLLCSQVENLCTTVNFPLGSKPKNITERHKPFQVQCKQACRQYFTSCYINYINSELKLRFLISETTYPRLFEMFLPAVISLLAEWRPNLAQMFWELVNSCLGSKVKKIKKPQQFIKFKDLSVFHSENK